MALKQSQSGTLLSARVSVRYGDKPAVLREVELKVGRGEVVGLVGQSGSGKSTLAMSILGLLDRKRVQADGAIHFEGRDLLKLTERKLRDLRGGKSPSFCRARFLR